MSHRLEQKAWGYLVPQGLDDDCIDLGYNLAIWKLGRIRSNQIILPTLVIDKVHCLISRSRSGKVTFVALQSNEFTTTVSGVELARGEKFILGDGSHILLGNKVTSIGYTYRTLRNNDVNIDYRFNIGKTLGSGAFGDVKLATSRASKQKFAIKIIVRSGFQNEFYQREIKIMKTIQHPQVIHVQEVYEEGKRIYIESSFQTYLVMELMKAGNLMDLIESTGGLLEIDTKKASWDICQGMQYLHSCGIAHRDLKPENVLIASTSPMSVKIADFGLAKICEGTFLQSVCGTPNFMAPEVWISTSKFDYDLVVDCWSTGVMVYMMLCGRLPFCYEDDDIAYIEEFYQQRQIQWQNLPDETSWRARDFIQRLLVLDPDIRLNFRQGLGHTWFAELHSRRNSVASTSTVDIEEVEAILFNNLSW